MLLKHRKDSNIIHHNPGMLSGQNNPLQVNRAKNRLAIVSHRLTNSFVLRVLQQLLFVFVIYFLHIVFKSQTIKQM